MKTIRIKTFHNRDVGTAGPAGPDVQWLLYLQDHCCYCMLFDTSSGDPFTDVQQLLTVQDPGCKIVW